MKRFNLFANLTLVVLLSLSLSSCLKETDSYILTTFSFNDIVLPEESYWNGSQGSGGVYFGMAYFHNAYNTEFDYWEGFAFSNITDTETPGYQNQYSAYIKDETPTYRNVYSVAYTNDENAFISFSSPANLITMKVTNSTWAYYSMLNGDTFAKKFEEGDWFKLTVLGFDNKNSLLSSVEFYLADLRSPANKIIDDWTVVDLSSLRGVSKIVFHLSSSDNSDWGMNTPSYVCIDDITVEFRF
jgi:hypothetical protein